MSVINEKIFSVSEFIELLNIGLKRSRAKIIGEVGEVKKGPTGHVYFTLQDEKDNSLINCIIWQSRYALYGLDLKEGVKIISSGYPEIYGRSGRLSFISETIELFGQGELKKQYDKLREKLSAEGLFDRAVKRSLPKFPRKIGIITSKGGAVLADFLNNLGQFGFKIQLLDCRMEGQEAVSDLLSCFKTFKKADIEVLLIMRGGGSLESLMPFNNEQLVREAASFPVPVMAGIGHHKDEPLMALTADFAESTPTACANLLNRSFEKAAVQLQNLENDIFYHFNNIFERYAKIKDRLFFSFRLFEKFLANDKIRAVKLQQNILSGFQLSLTGAYRHLNQIEQTINFNNPRRQLKFGYSIVRLGQKVVKSVNKIKKGDDLSIEIFDGQIFSRVEKKIKYGQNKNQSA